VTAAYLNRSALKIFAMEKLNIKFGTPEHGWMVIDLSSLSDQISSTVSDVPCDSLYELVRALVKLEEGSSEEAVEWSLEPEYVQWVFRRSGCEIEFSVINPDSSTPVFIYKNKASKLIHRFYKSLKDLETNPVWQELDVAERIWSWAFPSSLLSTLKQKIGFAEQ